MIEYEGIIKKYDELSLKLSDPDVFSDQARYRSLAKELSDLEPIASQAGELKRIAAQIAEAQAMIAEKPDKEMREFLQEELASLQELQQGSEQAMRLLLLPKDPNDDKNVIVEIRAGVGGEEAALFAGVLYRMYGMYAEKRGWQIELEDANQTEIGGFKEIVFSVEAAGAYSRFKYESGVHRVQRVPTTEASGRIHTSTVTVAVLPEADEVDVDIDPNDLAVDTFRASGAGGQHINKTDSAIRITHRPSGIVVTCQDRRSQHKNRDRAMAILRAKLLDIAVNEQASDVAQARRDQVGAGYRNERIRTYNYPQGRVTDHRINLTLYKIGDVLDGDIDEIIDQLAVAHQAQKISGAAEGFGSAGGEAG